jgi:signal transduction histidine kinase
LLLLLALALGAVGVFVDRFANAAIRAREDAETRRIDQAFKTREKEARDKFDAELLSETKALARELQRKIEGLSGLPSAPPPSRPGDGQGRTIDPLLRAPEDEVEEYKLRTDVLSLALTNGWHTLGISYATNPPSIFVPPGSSGNRGGLRLDPIDRSRPTELPRLSPVWSVFDAPRVIPRIQTELRKAFDDDEHPGSFQFDLVTTLPGHPGPVLVTVHSARLGHDLPSIDPAKIDRNPDTEYEFNDREVTDKGQYREVVRRRALGFWARLTPPTGFTNRPTDAIAPRVFANRHDMYLRVFVHHARPYSELLDRLQDETSNKMAQIEAVQQETRTQLTELRSQLGLIGAGSFLALVIGGWVIVARGLAPIRALSDAVSQVSEKDFRLPVTAEELGQELAPIHARLTQTLDLLRQAFVREKQSVADISHELRTPIASLLATIDVSLRKTRTSDQYRITLEDCRAIARQLGQLVERIMTLAALDAGSARTTIIRTDATEVATGCAAVIRPLAEAHGLTFAVRSNGPIELDTDPDQLREVLMNLLHNAIEYNRPGGQVELAVTQDGGNAVFEVQDTGIGMPPEIRSRIFERFFRADPSRHATGVHAGLGLAIVKEYVERLKGTVTVDSRLDTGTTFRVTVPAVPTDLSPEPAPVTSSLEDARSRSQPAPAGS